MNLYFDNASTSFPKPATVSQAVAGYITGCGGTYGRVSYPRAMQATRMVEECRNAIGALMGAQAGNIFFSNNATVAINTILKGLDLSNRTVLHTNMEHNAVMRPLHYLASKHGVRLQAMPSFGDGRVDTDALSQIDMSSVGLIVVNQQSNVTGLIQPLRQIMEAANGVPVMSDSTQSLTAAGLPGFGLGDRRPDFIVFTGHKALYGPTGTAGAYVARTELLEPLLYGGTGSNSDSYTMPEHSPDRFEAGTPNIAGICGLLSALENPPAMLHSREDLYELVTRIRAIENITLYCAAMFENQGETFSFTHRNLTPSTIAGTLYEEFGCEVRHGLHCTPLAHRTLGTFPAGTVRISLSHFHTPEDLKYLASAIETICMQ